MTKIMFVCHGNICRSPMAEFVMKFLANKYNLDNLYISSSATSYEEVGNDIHSGTKRVLDKHHIPYSKRSATVLTKNDYKSFDYIIAMDRYNVKNITRIIGSDRENKVFLLSQFAGSDRDIADPWYTGNFDLTFEDILKGCEGLIKHLLNN